MAPSPRDDHVRHYAGRAHHSMLSMPSHESCGREAASAVASRRAVASTAVCGVSACPEHEPRLLGGAGAGASNADVAKCAVMNRSKRCQTLPSCRSTKRMVCPGQNSCAPARRGCPWQSHLATSAAGRLLSATVTGPLCHSCSRVCSSRLLLNCPRSRHKSFETVHQCCGTWQHIVKHTRRRWHGVGRSLL